MSSSLNVHSLIVDACSFTNNTATGGGGGLNYSGQGTVLISNSIFTGNTVGSSGGGINTSGGGTGGTYTIEKCTFLSNTATGTGQGGAISNGNGQLTVRYCRFLGNSAAVPANGNVIWQSGGDAANTIIADNNWWGVNTGPAANDLANGPPPVTAPVATEWLQLKNTAATSPICTSPPSNISVITASFLTNNLNVGIAAANLSALVGLPITFNGVVNGTLSGAQTSLQASGTATVTFTAGASPGNGTANAVFVPAAENFTSTTNPVITINNCCPVITVINPATTTGTIGVTFNPVNYTFTSTGGAPMVTYSLDNGTLPTGIMLNANGTLSGTPTQLGSFPITVKATDGNSCTGIGGTYTLVISCPTINVSNPITTTGSTGIAFNPDNYTFTSTGGAPTINLFFGQWFFTIRHNA